MLGPLFSWPAVSVYIAVLIGLGASMMSMSPPEFQVSKICFSVAAFLLLVKFGSWVVTIQSSIWERGIIALLVFGLIGAGWAESIRWVRSRQPNEDKSASPPFRAEIRSVVFHDGPGPLTLFMVAYSSKYGQTTSPVYYLANIQIVNLQNVDSTIVEYSVGVSDNIDGPWDNLIPISLKSTNLYILGISKGGTGKIGFPFGAYRLASAMKQDDMRHAALLAPYPQLEDELGKPIPPHRTINGWAAFDSKKRDGTKRNFFRITVRDSANIKFSSVASLPIGKSLDNETMVDTRVGLMIKTGVIEDIGGFHVRYYSDPLR